MAGVYRQRHPDFQRSLEPVELLSDPPLSAQRMARAARLVGVGPMAAVAGTIAQLAAEGGIKIEAIEGVDGVLIVKDDRVGLAGRLPQLIKSK